MASRVLVTGASGFIGRALCRSLAEAGHQVVPLVRPGREVASGVRWDPEGGSIELAGLEGADAVVHLAGEGIASGRWTDAQKAKIRESRTRGTSLLARSLAGLSAKPRVLLSASAIGFYGDRGDEPLDETAGAGADFLAELAVAWEQAAEPAQAAGIRVVHPRIGIVLDPAGGALAKMLTPFKLGLGGPIGSGRQVMSWISLRDAVRALVHLLEHPELAGPVNLTAPEPVTNAELSRGLGRALHRPAVLPLPAFAARLALGEMADGALLSGARVLPKRLLASGFQFEHPTLEAFLRSAFG